MADVVFEEIECRSAIQRVQAADLPFHWALNPYRAGMQACGFCHSPDGGSRVIVKVNAADALSRDLAGLKWRNEIIAIGTTCEPYHAAELRYSLTHRLLKVLRDASNPAALFTRSALVARDTDILVDLSAAAGSAVVFPLATLDDTLRRRIEPASDPVDRRLRAMEQLAAAGVRCGVLLAPVAPGLTDDAASLERVLDAARLHGASFLYPNVLSLRPGTREWSMPLLREAYPHLAARFAGYYRGPHSARSYTQDVHRMIDALREKCRLEADRAWLRASGQLQLAI